MGVLNSALLANPQLKSVSSLECAMRFPFTVYTYERLESLSSCNFDTMFHDGFDYDHFRTETVDGIRSI